jgi:hypothetical protein
MAAVVIAEDYLLDFLRYYPSSSQMYQDKTWKLVCSLRLVGEKKGDVDMKHVVLEVFCLLIDSGKIFKLDLFGKSY